MEQNHTSTLATEYQLPDGLDGVFIPDGFSYSKDLFTLSETYKKYVSKVLIPEGLIADRTDRLAQNIFDAYKGKEVTLVVIMNSAFRFFSELYKQLMRRNEISKDGQVTILIKFLKITTYHGTEQVVGQESVSIPIKKEEVQGKHMLIVEDIYDSGSTIVNTYNKLKELEAESVDVAVLLHKRNPKNLKHKFWAKYIGFNIPDEFVIGYGMDYNEYYRDLNHMCIINQEGIEYFKR